MSTKTPKINFSKIDNLQNINLNKIAGTNIDYNLYYSAEKNNIQNGTKYELGTLFSNIYINNTSYLLSNYTNEFNKICKNELLYKV